MRQIKKEKVCVLIPAHNEERVIEKTLQSVVLLLASKDIYLVDDGSDDNTLRIAKKHIKHTAHIKNRGKASALNYGLDHFKLVDKYDFILFLDADARPTKDYLKFTLPHFKRSENKDLVCVSGRVRGIENTWISKYRQWEYQIAFSIHKRAQENLSSILVIPGCASIYRSSVFKKLRFPTGTFTEDMDFTFLMHRSGFNKMIFENKANVYTFDPGRISDFIIQLTRWYTGFWQVVKKHDVPWRGQVLDLEVAMLATEGLYNGILVGFILVAFFKLLIFGGIGILLTPFLIDLLIFFVPSLVWSAYSDRDFSRILYIPHFYFLRLLSSVIFIRSFFTGFLSEEKAYVWNSARYMRKEDI